MSVATLANDPPRCGRPTHLPFRVGAPLLIPLAAFSCAVARINGGGGASLGAVVAPIVVIGGACGLGLAVIMGYQLRTVSAIVLSAGCMLVAVFTMCYFFSPARVGAPGLATFEPMLHVALGCCWLAFTIECDWKDRYLWTAILGLGILTTVMNLALWVSHGAPRPYDGLAPGKNMLASVGYVSIYFALAGAKLNQHRQHLRRGFVLFLVLAFIMVFAANGRKVTLALPIAAFIYWAWFKISQSQWSSTLFFVLICICCVSIVGVFLSLDKMPYFWEFNELIREYSNREVTANRDIIWRQAVDQIPAHPIVGHGEDFRDYEKHNDSTRHAHNLYLVVVYRSGVVGLFGLILYLFVIWLLLCSAPRHHHRLAGAFFVGMLWIVCFTGGFITSNLMLSVSYWAMIGCGLSLTGGHDRRWSGHAAGESNAVRGLRKTGAVAAAHQITRS